MNKCKNSEELEGYIKMLEKIHSKPLTNLTDIKQYLKEEFDIDASIEEIRVLFEPTIVTDEEDLRIQYENVN